METNLPIIFVNATPKVPKQDNAKDSYVKESNDTYPLFYKVGVFEIDE